MERLKIILTLLITLAAIAAGAFLPLLVSGMSDQVKMGETGSVPIQPLALDILSKQEREANNMLRLLSQYKNLSNYPITAEEATMTEDEVYEAAVEGLQKYADVGVFEGFEPTFSAAEPYLGVSKDDYSNFLRFWTVSLVQEDAPYHSVFLHIDDATGKILYIKYEVYESFDPKTAYEKEHLIMEKFTEVYFSELGLDELGLVDIQYRDVEPVSVEEGTLDGDVLCVQYTFTGNDYDEFTMEFYVTGAGAFSVYFPD